MQRSNEPAKCPNPKAADRIPKLPDPNPELEKLINPVKNWPLRVGDGTLELRTETDGKSIRLTLPIGDRTACSVCVIRKDAGEHKDANISDQTAQWDFQQLPAHHGGSGQEYVPQQNDALAFRFGQGHTGSLVLKEPLYWSEVLFGDTTEKEIFYRGSHRIIAGRAFKYVDYIFPNIISDVIAVCIKKQNEHGYSAFRPKGYSCDAPITPLLRYKSFKSFAYRVVKNNLEPDALKRHAKGGVAIGEKDDGHKGPERVALPPPVDPEEWELLEKALKKLDPIDRQMIELKFFNEMSQVEIASVIGRSQAFVCTHIYASLEKLKLWMK